MSPLQDAHNVQRCLEACDIIGRHVDGASRILQTSFPFAEVEIVRPGAATDVRAYERQNFTLVVDHDDFVIATSHG